MSSKKKSIDFSGRRIAIATMHQKEQVIAPILRQKLGLHPFLAEINTDQLGTFSGEIERTLSPIEAARMKCKIAMDSSGCDIAIANEGSFGAHPVIFFAKADEELVVLLDRKNGIEITAKELSTTTNHDGITAKNGYEAIHFAEKIGFPTHGIILKDCATNPQEIFKDIISKDQLIQFLENWFTTHQEIWIETDLRAMRNPTRMQVIEKAVENLVEKINSTCPSCHFPGFWVAESISGLKCSQCGFPTKSTFAHKYVCQNCSFESIQEFPHQKKMEDPMYCDFCNP